MQPSAWRATCVCVGAPEAQVDRPSLEEQGTDRDLGLEEGKGRSMVEDLDQKGSHQMEGQEGGLDQKGSHQMEDREGDRA